MKPFKYFVYVQVCYVRDYNIMNMEMVGSNAMYWLAQNKNQNLTISLK